MEELCGCSSGDEPYLLALLFLEKLGKAREVLFKFYEALNPGGFLILGMVESLIGAAVNTFEHVDNRLRIYRKPEDKSLNYDTVNMLSQEEIDNIVAGMLGKERDE